jgi:predicted MFS family arabinose efflux permease
VVSGAGAIPSTGAPASPRRWATLGILTFIYVLNYVDRTLPSILAKPIQDDLGLSDGQLGLLGGLYFALFYGVLSVPVAWMADRTNRVRIVVVACALWSAATIACGLSRGYAELAAARMGVGVGEAGGVAPSYSVIAELFPADRRATALSLYNLGPPIGQMLGVAGGAALAATGGWRHAFLVVGAIGIVTALFAALVLREPARGTLDAASPTETRVSFAEGVRRFWADRTLRLAAAASAASAFIGSGTLAFLTLFLMREKGMSLQEVGSYFSVLLGVCVCAGIYASGRLVDRFSRRSAGAYGTVPAVATIASLPFFLGFVAAPTWPVALALLAVPLFCNYFYLTPAGALVQARVPAERRAMASALLLLVMNLVGGGLGPSFVGWASDAFKATHPAHALQWAFFATTPFFLLAIGLHLAVARSLRRSMR